jgi:hypothetical protein
VAAAVNVNECMREAKVMCMDHSIICKCGKHDASFNLKNELMPPEAIDTLHCPGCSNGVAFDRGTK